VIKVVGLGAGGHAKVVIEILRDMGTYELVGLLDPKEELWNSEVLAVPVIGDDSLLPALYQEGISHVFIGVGSIGDTRPRRRLYERARLLGFEIVPAIHSNAVVSPSAKIGHGVTIMAGAVINATARLGENVVINTAAIVEHDCNISNHVHVATGARLASTVTIGEGVHVGAGATVRQSISIGDGAIVGAGAVVVEDVPPCTLVVGVPARPVRSRQSSLTGTGLPGSEE